MRSEFFLYMSEALGFICLAVWIYLIFGRGGFWRSNVRDTTHPAQNAVRWPSVAVIIPARNESEFIGASVQSLLHQKYLGSLKIFVVDDDSNDDTAAVAARTAAAAPERDVTVITSNGPAPGWTGKLWALKEGISAAEALRPDYLLLTDADIVHTSDTVAWLVSHSLAGGYVLVSLMAKLRCTSLAERSHVPAFIYFFQMLFPFRWVSRPSSGVAAAAGGCVLVQADALARAGGIAAIRNALIDDCSLAAKLKAEGPIWLGLTERVRSVRPYETLSDVRQMISRSAYAQLRYSPLLLAATTIGLLLTFVAAPMLAIFASGLPRYLGLAVWLAMALSFVPTLRFYRQSPLWGLALPAIASLYLYYTLNSAYQYLRRRGGQWKGRVHDAPSMQ
jgi:hopene-associated glycosyltransferase HpnB